MLSGACMRAMIAIEPWLSCQNFWTVPSESLRAEWQIELGCKGADGNEFLSRLFCRQETAKDEAFPFTHIFSSCGFVY